MTRVIIRADASVQIGSGHVMRCLALAQELQTRGAAVTFVSRDIPGNLLGVIESHGMATARLSGVAYAGASSEDDAGYTMQADLMRERDAAATAAVLNEQHANLLIVDNYALDQRWEECFRGCVDRVLVIDDLADRTHCCDLLLDQNLCDGWQNRYTGLVPDLCRKLLGPGYALLRPEFLAARQHLRDRDGTVRRILICFGGSDPGNETGKALTAVLALNRQDIPVDLIVGGGNPHRQQLQDTCRQYPHVTFHCQTDKMADLMLRADLAIGGGGSTTWERCCLGLPTVVVSIAHHQEQLADAAERSGVIVHAGAAAAVTAESLALQIECLMTDHASMRLMAAQGVALVDGAGCSRVCNEIGI